MKEPAITLAGVTKFYRRWGKYRWQSFKGALLKGELKQSFTPSGHVKALEEVSLDVVKGEIVGIIGRNGSGKSTLLKVVAGLLKPNEGTVKTRGRLAALIELGAGFHPEITGRDNVIINGVMLGLTRKEIRRRMEDIIAFSELEDFIDEPVKSYSSGMYVRLGFSVAVHVDADILLVDEVLSVGDESFSDKCLDRILTLQAQGLSILFVSHDLSLVKKVCQRVVWLDEGRVQHVGDPEEVVSAYLKAIGHEEEGGEESARFGDGRARITRVLLEDEENRPTNILSPGMPLILRLEMEAKEPLIDFVFGISLKNSEGGVVYGTNTAIEGFKPQKWQGSGRLTWVLPPLTLTPGTYTIDWAIHAADGTPYDYWTRCLTFTVLDTLRDEGGVRPPHAWDFSGNIRIDAPPPEKVK